MGLGRLGFAGGLGHRVPASCAILGRLTEIGFWCVGLVWVMHHCNPPQCAFYGIEAWKGGQNPEGRFDGRGRSIGGGLRWVWVPGQGLG